MKRFILEINKHKWASVHCDASFDVSISTGVTCSADSKVETLTWLRRNEKGTATIGFALLLLLKNIEIPCNGLGGTIKFADLPEKIESFYRKESQLTGSLDPDNLLAAKWRGSKNRQITSKGTISLVARRGKTSTNPLLFSIRGIRLAHMNTDKSRWRAHTCRKARAN